MGAPRDAAHHGHRTVDCHAADTALVADPVDQPVVLMAAAAPTAAAPTAAVLPRNYAPIALPDLYTTTEDTARTVTGPGVLGNDTTPTATP